MNLPVHLGNLLATGQWDLPGVPGQCAGARFHSPTPLFVQQVCLVSASWGEVAADAPKEMLCGTCRDNLLVLQHIMGAGQGGLSWEIRREFGNSIRHLAQVGWDFYHEGRT